MILSGPEIHKQIQAGAIEIDPYHPAYLGPNSYDLHLGEQLFFYDDTNRRSFHNFSGPPTRAIDAKNPPRMFPVSETKDRGWLLRPGRLYLGHTIERTYCAGLVPRVSGRSSFGRLGVFCHVTAGEGDDGFNGTWTMELVATEPTVIYPGGRYFQIFFEELKGERMPYGVRGRYQHQEDPTASRIHIDADKTHGKKP